MNAVATAALQHELRFDSLFNEGRALAFPCDAAGRVDLDALSERARCNYFLARTLIGRDFAHPQVRAAFEGRAARAAQEARAGYARHAERLH